MLTIFMAPLLALSISVVPAGAIGNGTFAIAPLGSGKAGRSVFTPVLAPGTSTNDSVVVINQTASPLTLQLYAADAFTTSSGGFAIQPAYKPKHYMGSWIHLPASEVTVAPKSGDVIPFTYDPPAGIAPGDYTGGIVAVQTNGAITKKGAVRVRSLQALGVAVYGQVPGKLVPRLTVTGVSVSTTSPVSSEFGGPVKATVTYSVTNTGNENLTPNVTVSLSPLIGSSKKVHTALPRILPGSTVTFSHTFSGVEPFGHLTATVVASKSGAEGTGTASAVVIPWGLVVVVVVLVLLYLWRRRRRRHRQRLLADTAPPPDTRTPDAIAAAGSAPAGP